MDRDAAPLVAPPPAGPSALPPLAAPEWHALPGLVVVIDVLGRAVAASDTLGAWAGTGAAALLGEGFRAGLVPASRERLAAALATGEDFALRLEWQPRAAPLDCAASRLSDGVHWACLLHDASAGAQAEAHAGLFRLLADNVPALIAYFRASDNTCRFANRQYAATFGTDEQAIIGRTFAEVIGDEAAALIQPHVDTVIRERRAVQYERKLSDAQGNPRWIEVNLLPHTDPSGEVIAAFVLISDITRHRIAELAVRESEDRLAKFMQASVEGIVFHKDGFIVDVNPPICALTGFSVEEMMGRRTTEFIAPDEVAKVIAVIASGQETTYESVLIDKHGQRIPVEFIVRTMMRRGERLRMTIVRDIRDRRAAQARIHHLAHHDALTGLPNRLSFMSQVEAQIGAGRAGDGAAGGGSFALMFIDLDHFKRVNDSLGHLAGDTLLRTTAARIVGALRATDVVARFGGDEFVVLLPGLGAGPEAHGHVEDVAAKLLHAIEAPQPAERRPLSLTPSIGIAMFPADGDTPEALVQHADSAMYQAKAAGRATYRFFDRQRAGDAYAALVLEGELLHALERGEFELRYQPQLRAKDDALVGAEALLRWRHPERGMILPDEFIPVAERQRLMLPIGQWVLGEAVAAARRWHALGLTAAPVAVNLSTVQFQSPGFVESVAVLLEGAPPGLLEFELTERMLMDDLPQVGERLRRLQAIGVRISIDDFGTGWSSLGHLKHLPIDMLKIDRSFVHDLPTEGDSVAIARAIIQMAKSLGLAVVAEGVETEAQRRFLGDHGCDALQGLLIGAPLPAAEFERWLAERRRTLARG